MTKILLMEKSETASQGDHILAVLQVEPIRVPADTSTPLERAEWLGQPIIIRNHIYVIIKAARWSNTWYLQYAEPSGVRQ